MNKFALKFTVLGDDTVFTATLREDKAGFIITWEEGKEVKSVKYPKHTVLYFINSKVWKLIELIV